MLDRFEKELGSDSEDSEYEFTDAYIPGFSTIGYALHEETKEED